MIALRYAWRSLSRSRGFVIVSVLALGIGVGLSTTMFAVLDAIENPLVAHRESDNLFEARWWFSRARGLTQAELHARVAQAVEGMGDLAPLQLVRRPLEHEDVVQDVFVARVTPQFFSVAAVTPRLGRPFVESDGANVAIVADPVWRRLFANRAEIGDATIRIGRTIMTVIGVMPRGSIAPSFATVWTPLPANALNAEGLSGWPLLRLRPGVDKTRVEAVLGSVGETLTATYSTRDRPISIEIRPVLRRQEELRDIHKAMVGAALSILLIACVNLAHLMLARGLSKRRELAVRMAIGATRAAVVRQMFLECMIIAAGGAGVGALVAIWGADVINNRMPPEVSWIGFMEAQLSWRVFALSTAAVIVSAVAFGLIPAVQVARQVSLDEPLKDGAGTTNRTRGRYSGLVIAEVALALMLMMGGGVLLRTIHMLRRVEYSFEARALLTATVGQRGDSPGRTTRDALIAAIGSAPHVRAVAFQAFATPKGGAVTGEMTVGDSTSAFATPTYSAVSWQYFRVHGLQIVDGRDFEPGDAVPGAVILNSAAAQRLYPRGDAVGHTVKLGAPALDAPWVRVIGVARTAMSLRGGQDGPAAPGVFVVRPDEVMRWGTLLIRAESESPGIAVEVKRRLNAIPSIMMASVSPYTAARDAELTSRRFLAKVFVSVGSIALALAALGLYGVLAYAVNRRMREFAVRLALGARPLQLFHMIVSDGLVMILAGTGLGAFGALLGTRLLDAVLESVLPSDVISLVVCEGILIAAGLLATLAPALRASRADPMEILRAA